MKRPLAPPRAKRFHAVHFVQATLLCIGLFWLASRALAHIAGAAKATMLFPALVSVSAQYCSQTDSQSLASRGRLPVAALACSLLKERT